MVEAITDREALYINDLLNQQVVAVDKFSVYANECNDPELKAVCRELVNVNMRHFDRLLQQVNVSGIGASTYAGTPTRFTGAGGYSQSIPNYTTQSMSGSTGMGQYGATNTFGTNYIGGYGNYGSAYGTTGYSATGYTGSTGASNEGFVASDTGSVYGTRRF